jgi:hypothetical protein
LRQAWCHDQNRGVTFKVFNPELTLSCSLVAEAEKDEVTPQTIRGTGSLRAVSLRRDVS